jgi:class 3 adenylate cyclase
MLGFFFVSSLVCAVAAIRWVNKPFPGFVILENLRADRPGPSYWTGVQAGVRFPDRILAFNGRPVTSVEEISELVRRLPVGTSVTYGIEREGQRLEVPIATMTWTWLDALSKFGIMYSVGCGLFFLGVLVFVLKPDTEVSWTFFLAGLFLALDFINVFDYQADPFGVNPVIHSGMFIFPAAVIHMSTVFPAKPTWLARHRFLIVLPYLVSVGLLIGMEVLYHDHPIFETLHHVQVSYFALGALTLLASIAVSFWLSRSVLARTRAKVLLLGAMLALPIPAGTAILRSYGVWLGGIPATFTVIPLLVFPAAIAYAIVKHNLFDLDDYIKRTVGYAIMTAVVAGGYFGLHTVVKTMMLDPLLGAASEQVYPILFALLTVFAFNPISRKVQDVVDRLFFRKGYDYKKTVAAVSDALTSLVDLNGFLTNVIQTLRQDLFVNKAGVVLLDGRQGTCRAMFLADEPGLAVARSEDPHFAPSDPLLALLASEKKLITKYDVAEDPEYEAVRESCGRRFAELGASVAVPLFARDQFTGMLALGYKKSGHFYTREDIDLVHTLSSMTSTAIEQGREKAQRDVLMKLFSKHVAPEVAEAMWEQRELILDEGRPRPQKLLATIMFTDLQGFTSVSEKQDPQVLMDWLNTYMEAIATKVMEHGGVVDNYIGDAVKADFGVPIARTSEAEIRRDATNAVTCALALEQELVRLNAVMKGRRLPTLRMRVGICTGPVVAGCLGSSDRLKYTTLGDTVNTASRLESYDKELVIPELADRPCRILITRGTMLFLDDRFETRRVGDLSLKGKEDKIDVYCVLGRSVNAPSVEPALAATGMDEG